MQEEKKSNKGADKSSLDSLGSFDEGMNEVKELTIAIESLQSNSIFQSMDNQVIEKTLGVVTKRIKSQELHVQLEFQDKAAIRSHDLKHFQWSLCFALIIVVAVLSFLIFASIFFIQQGKDEIFKQILAFLAGIISGISGGFILKSYKDKGEKQKTDR